MDNEEKELRRKFNRAMDNGCVWLNSTIGNDSQTSRLFGTRGPQVTSQGKVWMVATAIMVATILSGIRLIFGPPLFIVAPLFSWPAIIFWTVFLGWNGRKLAKISPYRLRTGEGSLTWMKYFIVRLNRRISWLYGRPHAYTQVYSCMARNDGEPQLIDAYVYLGTAPAPYTPYNHTPLMPDELSNTADMVDGVDVKIYMPSLSVRQIESSALMVPRKELKKYRKEQKRRMKGNGYFGGV